MLDALVTFLLAGFALFAIIVLVAFVVVRLVFLHVARRIRDRGAARGLDAGAARAVLLQRLDRTARVMDTAIPLPLVGGIGVDSLIGFVPYVGDAVSALVSGSLIYRSLQYGVPNALVARMVGNMFLDLLVGAVPVVGDLFDIAFKANTRNIRLLRDYLQKEQKEQKE